MSIFGITGYYSDLLRHKIPDWIGVALLIAPIILILFVQWGEAPDKIVALTHILAASWFLALALGMELGNLLGYQPKGHAWYRILAHVGWVFAWAGVLRKARAYRKENGSKP